MNCRLIILDEPTAALTETETAALFTIVHRLVKSGIGVLYISHRMREVFENCDTITILRDGKLIDTVRTAETTTSAVVDKMVGRALSELYPPKLSTEPDEGDVMMEVRDLASPGDFRNVSFRLHRGEILGLFGLMGAGRSEIAKTICGLQERSAGEVLLPAHPCSIGSYPEAIRHGMIYLTEDRKTEGLFLPMSLKHNISAIDLRSISARSLINSKKEVCAGGELHLAPGDPRHGRPAEGRLASAAETSRRSSSGSSFPSSRGSFSWTSRHGGSTSAQNPRSTSSCAILRRRASGSSSFPPSCRR